MSDHPSREELDGFFQGTLPAARARAVVRHLLRPCAPCDAEMAALAAGLLARAPEAVELKPEEEAAYEAAIGRAARAAQARRPGLRRQREEARKAAAVLAGGGLEAGHKLPRRMDEVARIQALLERSWAARYEDPGLMAQLARLALQAAKQLSPRRHGAERVLDLQGQAWGELGNAYRLLGQLDPAEEALWQARELLELGSGSEDLDARLRELEATLAAARRRFEHAGNLLLKVCELHRRKGDGHLAGRALISRGLYMGYAGGLEEALGLLREGLAMVDGEREPSLVYAAVHNQLHFIIDLGRFRDARRFRLENSRALALGEGRSNRARLRWLEARIDAGLGNLARAEMIFREVKGEFEEMGSPFVAAITALDLAAVLLARQQPEEAEEVALAASRVFSALRIEREGLTALVVLRTAFEMGRATAALVREVAAFLRRAESDPNACFQPQPW